MRVAEGDAGRTQKVKDEISRLVQTKIFLLRLHFFTILLGWRNFLCVPQVRAAYITLPFPTIQARYAACLSPLQAAHTKFYVYSLLIRQRGEK
jgi:hypothetical protein